MMPAVKCLPVPSIILAAAAVRFLPIVTIIPFLISTSVASNLPAASLVQTVAFFIKMFSALGISSNPIPKKGYNTFPVVTGVLVLVLSVFVFSK